MSISRRTRTVRWANKTELKKIRHFKAGRRCDRRGREVWLVTGVFFTLSQKKKTPPMRLTEARPHRTLREKLRRICIQSDALVSVKSEATGDNKEQHHYVSSVCTCLLDLTLRSWKQRGSAAILAWPWKWKTKKKKVSFFCRDGTCDALSG